MNTDEHIYSDRFTLYASIRGHALSHPKSRCLRILNLAVIPFQSIWRVDFVNDMSEFPDVGCDRMAQYERSSFQIFIRVDLFRSCRV